MEQSKYFVPFLIFMAIVASIILTWLAIFMTDVFIFLFFIVCLAIFVWASS